MSPAHKKKVTGEFEITGTRIFLYIIGPIKDGGQFRRSHSEELFTHISKITDTIRKRGSNNRLN